MENFTNTVRDAGTISVTRRRVLRLPAVINIELGYPAVRFTG
jgi:hypothetical protein